METFTQLKAFTANPHFHEQRRKSLAGLAHVEIDEPIRQLIERMNGLPCCFTLQCCYGHFVYNGQEDPNNLDPLPVTRTVSTVEYRIAYIAMCIDPCDSGRRLFDNLKEVTAVDPENIQFCCAEWFWERQVNSYALQVEPDRFKHQDTAILGYDEALKIQSVRNEFFAHLERLMQEAE